MTTNPPVSLYTFDSRITMRGSFPSEFEQAVIKNEPMFFNCDLEFAHQNGGPITKAFIDALPSDWKDQPVVLDSRVHMLMKGWFPCIPGFHHDDVPRRNDASGQPDYDAPAYRSEHLMGLVNGDIAPTRFALVPEGTHGELGLFLKPPADRVTYAVWHDEVEKQLAEGKLVPFEAPSGQLLQFDWQSWHEGQRARASGWRWFVRLSRNTSRTENITNEFRRRVQVYLENPMQGW
jgi:hypothetical protein